MSNENQGAFQKAMADVAKQVQADADAGRQPAGGSTPPNPAPQRAQAPADPAAQGGTPDETLGRESVGGGQQRLFLDKYKSEEEAKKAHHLLIHGMNALKAKNDALEARLAAAAPPPLSPGRVDPSQGVARNPDDEKWKEGYGIDPADLDARIEARANALLEQRDAPRKAMANAEAYIAQRYPDFAAKVDDIRTFSMANPVVDERIRSLYSQGLYAEAMEIAYLAYDNAVRTFNLAAAEHERVEGAISADRQAGTMISSQAGGPRDPAPSPNAFPQSQADWDEIRAMRAAGRDAEVRQRLFGPLIAGIPELGGRRQR